MPMSPLLKAMNSSTIDIDFSLSPEPTKYADVLPDRCVEHHHWKEAMDDEMRKVSFSRLLIHITLTKLLVVHKDTLQLFLSVCAAESLSIYQADVKAAFYRLISRRKFMFKPLPSSQGIILRPLQVKRKFWSLQRLFMV